MSASKLPVLYSFWRSSCSYRVRIALNLKEIPYHIVPVNIGPGTRENLYPNYRAVNPMQKVPALQIDGQIINESLNIMHYLEETRPNVSLMPTDVLKRAKVREICEMIQSGIQPLQNVGLLIHMQKLASAEKTLEMAKYWIHNGFTAVENVLSTSSGKYSVGDEITLADCCLIPQVYNARKYGVDVKQFPTIHKVDQESGNHPAFIKAHPSNQPDCPPVAKNLKAT